MAATKTHKNLDAIIPPDIILVTCVASMWLITTYVARLPFAVPYRAVLAGGFMLGGLIIVFSAKMALRKHRTTERPDHHSLLKTAALVTSGPYAFSRNPIYLGMILLLIGWALLLNNLLNLLVIVAFVISITRLQIMPEEKMLGNLFGERYSRYKSQIRRWI